MLEYVLLALLGGGTWFLYEDNQELSAEKADLVTANKQLKQTLSDQQDILNQCYAQVEDNERIITEAETERRNAEAVAKSREEQLEKLRADNADVDYYLSIDIPAELQRILQDDYKD